MLIDWRGRRLTPRLAAAEGIAEQRHERRVCLAERPPRLCLCDALAVQRGRDRGAAHLRECLSDAVDVRHHRRDRPSVTGRRRLLPETGRQHRHEILGDLTAVFEGFDDPATFS